VTAASHIEIACTRASGTYPGAFLRLRPGSTARVLLAVTFLVVWTSLVSCSALGGLGQREVVADATGEITTSAEAAGESAAGAGPTANAGAAVGRPATGNSIVAEPTGHGVGPLMRVGLIEEAGEVRISCDGLCSVSLYGESTVRETTEGGEWRVTVEGSGFLVTGSGVDQVLGGTARIAPLGDDPVSLDGVRYRGELEVFLSANGGLSVVNVIGLESYLRGVVPKEIGPRQLSDLEAVKAQAVAARTYALARGGGRSAGDYDLYATVDDQAYGGAAVEDPTADRAISETAGLVLYHEGFPVNAYFSSCCGGWTAAREDVWELPPEPYLIAQSDVPGGGHDLDSAYCSGSPSFAWDAEWSGSEILELVRTRLRETASEPVPVEITAVRDIRIVETSGQGRIRWLEVEAAEGTWRVFADRVRWLLRRPGSDAILRSAWFDLDVQKRGGRVSRVRATGRGYGHGVGMCQNGALGMARRGFSYGQILTHYYPGTRLETPAGYWD